MELWRLYLAGVALALGACANLTVVIPGIAMIAAFVFIYLGPPLQERNWPRLCVRGNAILDRMIVPGVVISTAILLVPLLPAKREDFYLGASNWKHSLVNMGYASLWRPMNLLEHTPLHQPVMTMVEWVALALPPCILVLALLRWGRNRETMRGLLTLACVATFGLLFFLHGALGMQLPERRTGLYLIPLLTLPAVVVMESGAWFRKAGYLVAALILAQFLISFNVRYYDEWIFDAGSRQLAEYLREHAPPDGRTVTAHATFPLSFSIEFYRLLFGLEWLEVSKQIEAKGPFDVFLLSPEELPLMEKYHLTERYVHPGSNITIATAASSPLRP